MSVSGLQEVRLMPMFYMYRYDLRFLRHIRCNKHFIEDVSDLINNVRTLQDMCRIVLRQHYTDSAVYTFVNTQEMPHILKEYILLKELKS